MKRLLLSTFLAAIPVIATAPPPYGNANAASTCGTATDCVYDPTTDTSYFDPTSFHVTATGATGSDPVLLNNSSSFSIQDIGGQNISKPLDIFFAEPTGAAAPSITSVSYTAPGGAITNGIGFSTLGTVTGPGGLTTFATGTQANPSTSDLYTFVGCIGCDKSLNGSNITKVFAAQNITLPNNLTVYEFQVQQDFVGKDQVNISGAFANGTIVFPFAENGAGTQSVTIFDTSWTNTGFVDCMTGQPGCSPSPPPPPPPPPPGVPEPASLLLLGTGLLGTAVAVRTRRRRT